MTKYLVEIYYTYTKEIDADSEGEAKDMAELWANDIKLKDIQTDICVNRL